jgi:hypothetical protein
MLEPMRVSRRIRIGAVTAGALVAGGLAAGLTLTWPTEW